MLLTLFTDLIDALGKVLGGLKALAGLPRVEREKYRQTMGDTYRLIDTTLNMVIIRLGDVLLLKDDSAFLLEVARLDNFGDWMQAERAFRLCASLRAALRETETLFSRVAGAVSARDWDALLQQMRAVLATEAEVAGFIGERFRMLADAARRAPPAGPELDAIRRDLAAFRDALIAERQRLIRQETELYPMV